METILLTSPSQKKHILLRISESIIHLSPSVPHWFIGHLLSSANPGATAGNRTEHPVGALFFCLTPCFPSINASITQHLLSPSSKNIFLLFPSLSYIYCF